VKHINLLSLIQASDSLGQGNFENFLSLHGIKIKKAEIEDLKGLSNALYSLPSSIGIFDAFYVGYKIPQIGKEFDLLRFGKNFLVNIELKKTCTEVKVRNQLLRNRYYLESIGRQVYGFTYVSDTATLYYLQDDKNLVKVHLSSLRDLLYKQEVNRVEVVDDLFDPSDYLVSPFNSTRKFLNNEYFLTHQQEDVKDQIIKYLAGPKTPKFVSVIGSAGTGKTLLIYDIAKELRASAKNQSSFIAGI
jgi:type IV secretory pathway VirB4 component